MSKRSLFWGQASGKLGEAVYYRAGGEQRTRTWVPKIKNPKSASQALQRTKMLNMVAVFRGCKIFVNSFFKPEKSNQSPFNAFLAQNFPLCQWVTAKRGVADQSGQAIGFQFANGSLGLDTSLTTDIPEDFGATKAGLCLILPSSVDTIAPDNDENLSFFRGSSLYTVFTANENPWNLPESFTLSFVQAFKGKENAQFRTFSVECSKHSQDTLHCVQQEPNSAPVTVDELTTLITIAGAKGLEQAYTIGGLIFGDAAAALDNVSNAVCVVISYKDANGKVCTNSSMYATPKFQQYANDYVANSDWGNTILADYTTITKTL